MLSSLFGEQGSESQIMVGRGKEKAKKMVRIECKSNFVIFVHDLFFNPFFFFFFFLFKVSSLFLPYFVLFLSSTLLQASPFVFFVLLCFLLNFFSTSFFTFFSYFVSSLLVFVLFYVLFIFSSRTRFLVNLFYCLPFSLSRLSLCLLDK